MTSLSGLPFVRHWQNDGVANVLEEEGVNVNVLAVRRDSEGAAAEIERQGKAHLEKAKTEMTRATARKVLYIMPVGDRLAIMGWRYLDTLWGDYI